MIAGWLAGKISGLVIFCLAVLGVILIPAMVIQTVRLNGISVLGWYAVSGYKPMYEADEKALGTLRDNNGKLETGIKTCNGSIDQLKAESDARTKAANAKVAQANGQLISMSLALKKMQAIKSTSETCPVADQILRAGLE